MDTGITHCTPENIWALVILHVSPTNWIPPPCCCIRKECQSVGFLFQHKYTTVQPQPCCHLPRPRSHRYNRFSFGVPGCPSRKFSGFTSPCTYLKGIYGLCQKQATTWKRFAHALPTPWHAVLSILKELQLQYMRPSPGTSPDPVSSRHPTNWGPAYP